MAFFAGLLLGLLLAGGNTVHVIQPPPEKPTIKNTELYKSLTW